MACQWSWLHVLVKQRKQELMRQLLQPIVSKFDELLHLMSAEPDSNIQLAYATCVSHAMGFAR